MMPSTVLLLLLILFLSNHLANSTEFVVHGTIHCPQKRVWCFHIRVMEKDRLPDDKIAFLGTVCHPLHSNSFRISGTVLSDELKKDLLQVYVTLHHNCTADGSIFKIERKPVFANQTEEVVKIPWSGFLYMLGKKVGDYAA